MKNKLKYKPSENEYMSLREELIQRTSNINSQASSAIVAIISAWAAGFSIWISVLSKDAFAENLILKMDMKFFMSMVFVVPIYFFIPLAVKSGENLVQIASISAYIRVFYEYSARKYTTKWNLLSFLTIKIYINAHKYFDVCGKEEICV